MDKAGRIIRLLLVHSLNESVGGMEVHQTSFIKYFFCSSERKGKTFNGIIENKDNTYTVYFLENNNLSTELSFLKLQDLIKYLLIKFKENILFFLNDAWWIEELPTLRKEIPSCRLIMRTGGNDIEYAPWHHPGYTYKERRLLWSQIINLLDFIIANSDFTVNRLLNLNINKDIIIKIRGGVDNILANYAKEHKKELRIELISLFGIKDEYIISFASRFVPFKGIIGALTALRKSNIYNKVHILIMGEGVLEPEIRSWLYNNMEKEKYTFLGKTDNINVIKNLAASDLTVNASLEYETKTDDGLYIHTETMGRTMMESICAGTPILATNVGGTKELFDECGYIGKLVMPNMASLIEGFDSVPQIIKNKVITGCNYSWEYIFKKYEELI